MNYALPTGLGTGGSKGNAFLPSNYRAEEWSGGKESIRSAFLVGGK
jgi:hypothetical protein